MTGTSVTIAADFDNKVAYIDVPCPRERYLRLYVQKGLTEDESSSASPQTTAESAVAYLYNPKVEPVTHATDVSGELHFAPSEGTA